MGTKPGDSIFIKLFLICSFFVIIFSFLKLYLLIGLSFFGVLGVVIVYFIYDIGMGVKEWTSNREKVSLIERNMDIIAKYHTNLKGESTIDDTESNYLENQIIMCLNDILHRETKYSGHLKLIKGLIRGEDTDKDTPPVLVNLVDYVNSYLSTRYWYLVFMEEQCKKEELDQQMRKDKDENEYQKLVVNKAK